MALRTGMGFLDIIKGLMAAAGGVTAVVPPTASLPNRFGTFIAPDVYPGDLGANPPFHVLPGLVAMDKEVVGCYVKASEGLGWGAANEDWFRRAWRELRTVGGDRYGVDWFRSCYHFLRFEVDGARQADYFCDLVDSAGGWGEGDMMPWVDIEEGGQGHWAGGQRLEDIKDPMKRARLAQEITERAASFIKRFKERTGLRIMVYGRGVFRDLGMSSARFGADGVANPAYTEHMPSMEAYGWPLRDVQFWQACGDGEVYAKGFPKELPGWGKTDYSVYVNGSLRTSLADFRQRCLAKPR